MPSAGNGRSNGRGRGKRKNKPDPGWLAVQREWHGSHFRPDPPKSIHQVGDLMPGLIKKMGLEDTSRLAEIQDMWVEVAGAGNAAHATPGRWESGVLIVYVDQPIWLAELKRFAARPLEKKLKERLGPRVLKAIRFELDPGTD